MVWKRHAPRDAARGLFGLIYWNLRKTIYRRRGGRCPCQNQSDDPIPGRVRCDAAASWGDPGRFRVICPLLVSTPDGWRCSVGPAGVRPFWGRAVRLATGLLLGSYLLGTVLVFAAFRLVNDAPVGWTQVAWPGRWREIPRVQSAHLFQQAIASFRGGRVAEAHLALEAARRRHPENYEAALLLAQIAMFQRSFLFADQLFTELQAGHPEHRLQTAVTYHDTLLGMDRLPILAIYALNMAQADPPRAAIWMRSALLAVRSLRANDAARLEELLSGQGEAFAPHARLLLHAEFALQAGRREEGLQQLRQSFPGPYNPFYVAYQIERLAGSGAPDAAQAMLDQLGPILGEFEHLRLQVMVTDGQGDRWGRQVAFAALLKMALTTAQAERVAALLIAYPDAELGRWWSNRVGSDVTLQRQLGPATMWVTALVCGNRDDAERWRARASEADGGELPDLKAIDFTRRDILRPDTALHLINTVTFPREVILALLWRTSQPAAAVERTDRG